MKRDPKKPLEETHSERTGITTFWRYRNWSKDHWLKIAVIKTETLMQGRGHHVPVMRVVGNAVTWQSGEEFDQVLTRLQEIRADHNKLLSKFNNTIP